MNNTKIDDLLRTLKWYLDAQNLPVQQRPPWLTPQKIKDAEFLVNRLSERMNKK